jgi:hypothetical protein
MIHDADKVMKVDDRRGPRIHGGTIPALDCHASECRRSDRCNRITALTAVMMANKRSTFYSERDLLIIVNETCNWPLIICSSQLLLLRRSRPHASEFIPMSIDRRL